MCLPYVTYNLIINVYELGMYKMVLEVIQANIKCCAVNYIMHRFLVQVCKYTIILKRCFIVQFSFFRMLQTLFHNSDIM